MATVVWVVGTTRSGTSWVFDLVASHPDVSMGYESKIPIEGIAFYERWKDRLTDPLAMAGLLEDLRTGIDDPTNVANNEVAFTQADLPQRIFEAHEADPGWATVCEQLFRAVQGTSHWGNKTLRVELTPLLEEHWPDSRFIVLIRDPRGVLASQAEKFENTLDYSAMYWLTHADWVLNVIQDNPHYRVVNLVEMARDPRPHLEWLFRESGLSLDPIEDLVQRFPGDPERLDAWRTVLPPKRQRRMEEYCYSQMKELGYTPQYATGQRRLGRSRRLWAFVHTFAGRVASSPSKLAQKQVLSRLKAGFRGS